MKKKVLVAVLALSFYPSVWADDDLLSDSNSSSTNDAVNKSELPVSKNNIGMCRFLGKDCLDVLNPKVTNAFSYGREDKRIIQRLSGAESETVSGAYNEQHQALSNSAILITAKTLGEQTGYAVGIKRNLRLIVKLTPYLNKAVNNTFRGLVITDSKGRMILPPVIEETAQNAVVSPDGKSFRAASRNYRIVKNARFILSPPTWQTYLKAKYKAPQLPAPGLLPKNATQKAIWKQGIKEGYRAGIEHARRLMIYQMNHIARDISGMVRYKVLRAYNMVSEPKVSKRTYAVTGGGNNMSINDQILRIKVKPMLNSGAGLWKSLPKMPDIRYLNIDGSDALDTRTDSLEQ